jgi:hypothetical protein
VKINHKNKYIFVHVPKTAGVSILSSVNEGGGMWDNVMGHTPISEIRKRHRKEYDEYFKFAFVRNPWDRIVSAFHFLTNGGRGNEEDQKRQKYLIKNYNGDFKKFIKSLPLKKYLVKLNTFYSLHFLEQTYWLCDERGNIDVDFVGKFENLKDDFKRVCKCGGIKSAELSRHNKSTHNHYTKYYDEEMINIISELYEKDISLFGYTYDMRK